MKSAQIGSATRAPDAPSRIDSGWSKPTHTPATTADEKPTNQASRESLVVPVLPPITPRTPWARPRPIRCRG